MKRESMLRKMRRQIREEERMYPLGRPGPDFLQREEESQNSAARKVAAGKRKWTRHQVFDRDDWQCQECHYICVEGPDPQAPDYPNADHIKPWSIFFDDSFDNMQTLCFSCNMKKSASYDDFPPSG